MKNFTLFILIILSIFSFVGCATTNLGTKVICENGNCQVEEKGN